MLSLHLVVLRLPVLNLLSNTKLTLRECLIKLLILLLELKVLDLVALNELLLLSLKVLVFLELHGSFSLSLRLGLLNLFLELLESLSLLLVLDIDSLLFLLDTCDSLLHCLLPLVFFLLESLFVSFDRLSHLIVVLLDSLLLEGESLVFKSLLTLEVDLGLGELVHRLVIFQFKVLDFGGEGSFFGLDLLSELFNQLVFAFHLTGDTVLLILKAENCTFSLGYFGAELLNSVVEISSLLGKFVSLGVVSFVGGILQSLIVFFDLGKLLLSTFKLLLHHLIFFFILIKNVLEVALHRGLLLLKPVERIFMVIIHLCDSFFVVVDSLIQFLFVPGFLVHGPLFKSFFFIFVKFL